MNDFLHTLQRWLATGVNGAIEWTDGKRRRVAFIEDDDFVLVQSNLRGESLQKLTEEGVFADLEGEVRRLRLRGLLMARDGTVAVHPGVGAPSREPISVALALWEVASALPAFPSDAWPRANPDGFGRLQQLPWSADLVNYLGDLDGSRPSEDVLDFGPASAGDVEAALTVAWLVGAVTLAGSGAVSFSVTGSGGGKPAVTGLFQTPKPVSAWEAPDETTDDAGYRVDEAKTHFEALGVAWQDSPETIRKAFMALASQFHPDRVAGATAEVKAEAERRFDIVREAWEVLGDAKKRDAYTRKVVFGEQTEEELAEVRMHAILEAERLLTLAQRDVNAQRFGPALETLLSALASDPDHPQIVAYHAYCVVRLNVGKPAADEAAARIEGVVKDIPTADWARVLQGRARLARGDVAGAQRAFVEALRLNPSNLDALNEMKRAKSPKNEKESNLGFFDRLFKR